MRPVSTTTAGPVRRPVTRTRDALCPFMQKLSFDWRKADRAPFLFDALIDHDSDGLLEGDDDLLVVVDVLAARPRMHHNTPCVLHPAPNRRPSNTCVDTRKLVPALRIDANSSSSAGDRGPSVAKSISLSTSL